MTRWTRSRRRARRPTSRSLTSVVEQNPGDPGAYNVRGTAYGKAGKLKEANGRLRQGDQAQPGLLPGLRQPRARRARHEPRRSRLRRLQPGASRSIRTTRSPTSAAATCTASASSTILRWPTSTGPSRLDGNDPRAYHNRGLVYQAQRPARPGDRRFLQGDPLAPGNSEPFNARGLSYLALGDAMSALDDFNEVVKRDADFLRRLDQPGPGAREARRPRQRPRRLRLRRLAQARLPAGRRRRQAHRGRPLRREDHGEHRLGRLTAATARAARRRPATSP